MRAIVILFSFLAASLLSTGSIAKSVYIDSALAAIDSANGQARLDLNRGTYKATSGSSEILFEIGTQIQLQVPVAGFGCLDIRSGRFRNAHCRWQMRSPQGQEV
jgi:hypothetical protein